MAKKLLVIAGVLLTAAAIGVALFLRTVNAPIAVSAPVRITVRIGQTTTEIADTLRQAALIESPHVFVWWAKLRGIDRYLQPGIYEFADTTSIDEILEVLRAHEAVTSTITIPEGWTVEQISYRVAEELGFSDSAIIELAYDTDVLRRWEVPIDRMEGYLLPETYEFYLGVTPTEVIDRFAAANRALRDDSLEARLEAIGFTWHETLTLASMVEAEVAVGDERPRIAAVFHNRLERGMKMQCDPTVVYAMGGLEPGRILWTNDLKFESPYNTYLHTGLPPGPICNPGAASIMAALYPDSTRELYFVADGTGRHIFSRTLAEHNRARMQIKRNNGR